MMKWLGLAVALVLSITPAFAEADKANSSLFTMPVPEPSLKNIPILSTLQDKGARIFYMGQRSGLNGWFVLLNGQVQMVYTTSDNKTALIGALFTNEGNTVSTEQITSLMQTNRGFATTIDLLTKERAALASEGQAAEAKPNIVTPFMMQKTEEKPVVKSEEKKPELPPSDLLMQDMEKAKGVVLGHNDKAQIIMVFEPRCPHCKASWKELQGSVLKNALQVKLVPVAFPEGEAEREAAQLVSSADPLAAWNKYIDGDKTVLAGKPDDGVLKAVRSNYSLAQKWGIKSTPYFVYRNKEGKIKILLGKPDQFSSVLAELVN